MFSGERHVGIRCASDIVTARQEGRAIASELGFKGSDLTLIATGISEVARNIVVHAKRGEIIVSPIGQGTRRGIRIVARDKGPGIQDVAAAMQYGYSSRSGLGVGLPGAKWLMDAFEIESKPGKGTIITMTKWLR